MEKEKKHSLIFSESEMKLINERVIDNLDKLKRNKDYNDLEGEVNELEMHIEDYFDEGQKKILNKYLRCHAEITDYYIVLAYYLGMKSMGEINKLK